jgi:hypothetical protein
MAVVIIATPGDPNANSYATLAEANTYHESVLEADAEPWNDADVDVRNRALVQATRLLDANIAWTGWPATSAQVLGWPRIYAYTRTGGLVASNVIPNELKNATAELARRLIVNGMPDTASDTEGLKRLKAGPVELEFDGSSSDSGVIPALVLAMIAFLVMRSSHSSSVPVIRS